MGIYNGKINGDENIEISKYGNIKVKEKIMEKGLNRKSGKSKRKRIRIFETKFDNLIETKFHPEIKMNRRTNISYSLEIKRKTEWRRSL